MIQKRRRPTFLQRLVYRAAKYAGLPLRDPALVAMFGREPSSSGIDVDEATALNASGVWAAVQLISSAFGMFDPVCYELGKAGTRKRIDDPVRQVLALSPNPEMPPVCFYETLMAHVLAWGNCFAQIEWADDEKTVPLALWPILPNQIYPDREYHTGNLIYRFTAMFPGEENRDFDPEDILHVPGLGFDGVRGYSVVQMARESIGLALGTERYGASFFGRGAVPEGIISHPLELGAEGVTNLRESFENLHRGPENAHRIGVLEEGAKYTQIGMSSEDAQFLQTRQFQTIEIARWFNVPPHMIRDLSAATFSNIEHQGMEFVMYTMLPWINRWRQHAHRKLYKGHPDRAVDFDTRVLLRADRSARYAAYGDGRNGGWLTLNDILREEGENPISGEIGDQRLAPSTMRVLGEPDPNAKKAMTADQIQILLEVMKRMKGADEKDLIEIVKEIAPTSSDEFYKAIVHAGQKIEDQEAAP